MAKPCIRHKIPYRQVRKASSNAKQPFAIGDCVLLRRQDDPDRPPIMIRALKPGVTFESHRGRVYHDNIIGKGVREVIKSTPANSKTRPAEYRLHQVTLEDYILQSKRLVTPIYPHDAALIVNLLDLHPDCAQGHEQPKLEILEAGTGHGGLTLHLSRAIHAANSPRPSPVSGSEDQAELELWKTKRNAIIHTIDQSPKYSAHAETVVKGFRKGIYAHNVDFHVGNVGDWLTKALSEHDGQPFLSHAILDLAGADAHLSKVAQALHTDGTLIVFNPSITQIVSCAAQVRKDRIDLSLERVLELGTDKASGGRDWAVKFVKPRAKAKEGLLLPEGQSGDEGFKSRNGDGEDVSSADELDSPDSQEDAKNTTSDKTAVEELSTICRPKVGNLIVGGGFLGIWKRMRHRNDQD